MLPEVKQVQQREALGRSQGGFSTKIHLRCEGNGLPIPFLLTAGQRHEAVVFEQLMEQGSMKRSGAGRPQLRPQYARRAGIEGTLSQGVRALGLRRSRYIGLAKTHLQHLVTAVAINLVRLMNWWEGMPKTRTRTSRFGALAQNSATG